MQLLSVVKKMFLIVPIILKIVLLIICVNYYNVIYKNKKTLYVSFYWMFFNI